MSEKQSDDKIVKKIIIERIKNMAPNVKIALISYDESGHRGCIIEDAEISKLHGLFFKYLWKSSRDLRNN